MTPELNLASMTPELKWEEALAFMAFWLS